MNEILTNAGDRTSISKILKLLIVAIMAVAIAFILGQTRAEAGEVCAGSECDTVAFVDNAAVFTLYQDLVPASLVGRFYYGNPGDEPLMGDWNCDGEQTPGMYRRSTGLVYLRNSNTQGNADSRYIFGNPSDIPIVGDFNGDGCDTVSIYRPSETRFYLSYTLGAPLADVSFFFGGFNDKPLIGDFDDDGVDTVGIFRPSNGLVALTNGHRGGTVDHQFYFGGVGDQMIVGDWDGDGDDTVGIYRYSNGVLYLNNEHRTGSASYTLNVGRYRRAVAASGVNTVPAGVVAVPGIVPPPPRTPSGPIEIHGESNVVIENLHISNPDGRCVTVTRSSNVIIRNSTIGPCGDEAVYLSDVDTALVTDNYITDTGNGVLVHRSESIRVDGNALVNAGRNFVQFDKVNGGGSSISGNRGQNELGGSNAEDLISLFASNGTAGSPILIVGNHLRNGGPSDSGSGIMLGDGGGSHQLVEGNVLVNPGQVGIGVASGYDIAVRGNRIFSSAVSWSNTGLYVWNQYDSECDDITVAGNQVNWTASGGYSNGWWDGGGCSNLSVHDNDWDAPIGAGIW
jgi:hypothetical protein